MVKTWLKKHIPKRRGFESRESTFLAIVVAYVIADALIFGRFDLYVREPVISQISGLFVTVEGVLIGLTPQIKVKRLRNIVALFGITALLVSVGTFGQSTYQAIQLSYLSWLSTSILFQTNVSLFLGFVEVYAFAILYPFTPKDPDKEATKKVAEAW